MLLTKYYKYVNDEILTESNVKPDPPGYKDVCSPMNYKEKFTKIVSELMDKANKESLEIIIKSMQEDLKGKLICMTDDANGKQRILKANKIEAHGGRPRIVENDNRKFVYNWDNDAKSKIFKMDDFLEYFEEHFLDQFISFQGKPTKGGQEAKYIKHIIRIGIYGGTNQDNIVVETDEGTQLLLLHQHPIKILDKKLKQLDPYGEENWDE